MLLATQHLEGADRLAKRIRVIDLGRSIHEGILDEVSSAPGRAMLELSVVPEHRDNASWVLLAAPGIEPVLDRYRVTAPDGTRSLLAAVRGWNGAGIEPEGVHLINLTPCGSYSTICFPLLCDRSRWMTHGNRM